MANLLEESARAGKLDNTKYLVAQAQKMKPDEDAAEKWGLHALLDEWANGPSGWCSRRKSWARLGKEKWSRSLKGRE